MRSRKRRSTPDPHVARPETEGGVPTRPVVVTDTGDAHAHDEGTALTGYRGPVPEPAGPSTGGPVQISGTGDATASGGGTAISGYIDKLTIVQQVPPPKRASWPYQRLLARSDKRKGKTPPTETALQTTKPFEESWTGDEDPQAFSKRKTPVGEVWFSIGLAIFMSLSSHYWITWRYGTNAAGVIVWYGITVIFLLGALNDWIGITSFLKLKKSMHARTLRIDKDGITTTDSSDDSIQRFPWTSIAQVSVRHTEKTVCEHNLLALHLQMYEQDDWVPVCVLGPLPDFRRLDMKNAVAAYTKQSLKTEEDW
jgi:hypothetical protein